MLRTRAASVTRLSTPDRWTVQRPKLGCACGTFQRICIGSNPHPLTKNRVRVVEPCRACAATAHSLQVPDRIRKIALYQHSAASDPPVSTVGGTISPYTPLFRDNFAGRTLQSIDYSLGWLTQGLWDGPTRGLFSNQVPSGRELMDAKMGVVLAAMPLSRLSGGTSSLFRAVGPDELADIQSTGVLRSIAGLEGKYFTTSAEAASSYARQAVRAFGDPPYTLIRVDVSNSIFRGLTPATVDSGIPAWVIPNSRLPGLSPQVLDVMPLPGL